MGRGGGFDSLLLLLHGRLGLDVRSEFDGNGGRTLVVTESGIEVEIVAFLDAGETLDDGVGFGVSLVGVKADLDLYTGIVVRKWFDPWFAKDSDESSVGDGKR